jgi:hypothetical protein
MGDWRAGPVVRCAARYPLGAARRYHPHGVYDMSELELLARAAIAGAASTPGVPALIELAEIGIDAIRNARVQTTLSEFEIERAFRRNGSPCR